MRMHGRAWFSRGLALWLVLSSSMAALASVQSEARSNAALQYWQAFALLPPLNERQARSLEDWQAIAHDEQVRKWLEEFESSRKYLLRASELTACDWGLDYRDGEFLQLPYVGKARTLARLAALHARREFEAGRWTSGIADIQAMFQLARHLETEPIMFVQMTGFAIEELAMNSVSAYLKKGGGILVDPLEKMLRDRATPPKPSEVIRKEKQVCVAGLLHRLIDAETHERGGWRKVWEPLQNDTEVPVTSREMAVAAIESIAPYYDRLAKQSELPWDEFDPTDGRYTTKLKADNRLAYVYLATMVHYVGVERRARTRLELFRAALSVVRGGREALNEFHDPAGDGRQTFLNEDLGETGFRLSSRLADSPSAERGARPVSVTVGESPNEPSAVGRPVK